MERGIKKKVSQEVDSFMNTYFLDTSIIIDYLHGKEQAVQAIDSLQGDLTSSYLCLAELFEGVFRVKERETYKKLITNFFAGLSFIYGLDSETAEKFGEISSLM